MPIPILYAMFLLANSLRRSIARALRDEETRGLVFTVLALIGVGTVFYHVVEGWSWVDSLYFTVITLTTIGYGDFTPQTDAAKLFTILYALLGLGLLATFVTVIARNQREWAAEQRERRRKE